MNLFVFINFILPLTEPNFPELSCTLQHAPFCPHYTEISHHASVWCNSNIKEDERTNDVHGQRQLKRTTLNISHHMLIRSGCKCIILMLTYDRAELTSLLIFFTDFHSGDLLTAAASVWKIYNRKKSLRILFRSSFESRVLNEHVKGDEKFVKKSIRSKKCGMTTAQHL